MLWTAACQTSLSFTISWSLLKLMSVESIMPSNHLILCYLLLLLPLIFPSIWKASGSFPMSQLFTSYGQSIGVSASAPVLPMNIPLGLTGLISLLSSSEASVLQRSAFFIVQLSHAYGATGKIIALTYMNICR